MQSVLGFVLWQVCFSFCEEIQRQAREFCNFSIACMVDAVLLKTDEKIYNLNCNAKT